MVDAGAAETDRNRRRYTRRETGAIPQPAHLNRNKDDGMTAIGVWRGLGHSRGLEKLTFLILLVGLAIISLMVGTVMARSGAAWLG